MMNETEFLIAFNSAAGAYNAEAGGGSLNSWGYTHVETWEDEPTGFKATAYKDASGNYVLAFAGTEDAQDWYQNLASFGMNQWTINKGPEITSFFQEIKNDEAQELNSIQFTGHSLGGALAQYAAYDFVSAGIVSSDQTFLTTFNALGGEAGLLNEYGIDYKPGLLDSANIHHYYDPSDLVSRLSTHVGGDSTNYQIRSSTDAIFTGDAHFMTTIQGFIADGQLERGLQVSHPYFDIEEVAPALQLWNEVFVGWEGGETEANSVEAAARLGSMIAILPYVFLNGSAEDQWSELKAFLVDNLVETLLADKWGISSDEGKEALKVALDYSFQGLGEALSDVRVQTFIQGVTNLTAAFADAYDWLAGDPQIEPSYRALSYSTLNYLVGATLSVDANGHFDEKITEDRSREIFSFSHAGDNKASFTQLMNFVAQLTGQDLTVNPEAEIALVNSIVENGIRLADFMVPADSYTGERLYNMVTEHAAIPTIIPDPLDARLVRYSIINQVPFILEGVSSEFIDPGILTDAKYALVEESEQYWNDRIEFFQQAIFEKANDEPVSGITKGDSKYYWDAEVGDLLVGENTNGQGGSSTLDKTEVSNVVFGSDTADSNIHGYDHDDYLYGRGGDDTLYGRSGRDDLEGNIGNDTLYGGADTDYLYGGTGDDHLHGDQGIDFLYGGDGSDTYYYSNGDGNDFIHDIDPGDRLNINGSIITSITQVAPDSDTYQDEFNNTYVLSSADGLVVKVADGGLQGTITIQSFSKASNNFGITFNDYAEAESPDLDAAPITATDTLDSEYSGRSEAENNTSIDYLATHYYGSYGSSHPNGTVNTLYHFQGGATNDSLTGGGYNDLLYGMAGDDFIDGVNNQSGNVNMLYGGLGSDHILGGNGSDYIWGNEERYFYVNGDDVLEGPVTRRFDKFLLDDISSYIAESSESGDFIDAGQGDDRVGAGEGDDLVLGGLGNDVVTGASGADVLIGNEGEDIILGDAHLRAYQSEDGLNVGWDYLSGNEIDQNISYDDVIDGGEQNDFILGGVGDDVVYGGSGDDSIHGDRHSIAMEWQQQDASGNLQDDPHFVALEAEYHGNDIVFGESGNDLIKGNGGDDYIDGGRDNDSLYGDNNRLAIEHHGNDVIKGGHGNDQIVGGGGSDTIDGGSGENILLGDYSWDAHGNLFNDEGQYHGADNISGGDQRDIIIGGGKDDTINSGGGDDLIYGDSREGAVTAYEISEQYHGNDTIDAGSGNDVVYGDAGEDYIVGGVGADSIHGGEGDDILRGGADGYIDGVLTSDFLNGGKGNDTYLYELGDGTEVIEDYFGENAIKLGSGVDSIHTYIDEENNEAFFSINGTSDVIVVSNAQLGSFSVGFEQSGNEYSYEEIKELVTGDISLGSKDSDDFEMANDAYVALAHQGYDTVTGNALDNRIYGQAGNDILSGGLGNDRLYGGSGDDTYKVKLGEGQTSITTSDSEVDAFETILLDQSITEADIVGVERVLDANAGRSISVVFSDSSRVNILGWWDNHASKIDAFVFSDEAETTWDALQLESLSFGASDENNTIKQFLELDFDNHIDGLGGDDTIEGLRGDDVLYGGAGNDTVRGGGQDAYGNWIKEDGDDQLFGGAGDDFLVGGDGNDLLYGEEGNDRLIGGSSTYSTVNVVTKLYGGEGDDSLQTVQTFNDGIGSARFYLYGGEGNDSITGYLGGGFVEAGEGNDSTKIEDSESVIYKFNAGDGQDLISRDQSDWAAAPWVVELGEGFVPETLQISRVSQESLTNNAEVDDLLIGFGATSDSLQLKDFLGSGQVATNQFELRFSNGTSLFTEQLISSFRSVNGTVADETFTLTNLRETVNGGTGNDTYLSSDSGDTFVFDQGWGQDVIDFTNNMGSGNRLVFGAGILESDLLFSRISENNFLALKIEHVNGSDQLIVKAPYAIDDISIEGRPEPIQMKEVLSNLDRIDGTSGNDIISGYEFSEVIFGHDGNDILRGYSALTNGLFDESVDRRDTFYGGNGDDSIYAVGVGEIAYGEAGDDHLYGGSLDGGVSTFYGGLGDDTFYSPSSGDAVFWGGEGEDTLLHDDMTSNVVTFDGGAGNDLVQMHDYSGGSAEVRLQYRGDFGQDRIEVTTHGYSFAPPSHQTILSFTDESIADVGMARVGDLSFNTDLLVFSTSNADSQVRIKRFFTDENVRNTFGLFEFSDGQIAYANDGDLDAFLELGSGDDILFSSGLGESYLTGKGGNDTYVFNSGDGSMTINNYHQNPAEESNILQLRGIAPEQISLFKLQGKDLLMKVGASEDQVKVLNYFNDIGSHSVDYYRLDGISFDNGTFWSEQDVLGAAPVATEDDDILHGSDFDDVLYALGGDDQVIGRGGNDVISGGKGHDLIVDNYGTNRIIYNLGDGDDLIQGTHAFGSTLVFGPGIDVNNIRLSNTSHSNTGLSSLLIEFENHEGSVTIDRFFNEGLDEFQDGGGEVAIESIEFDNGLIWSREEIFNNAHKQPIAYSLSGNGGSDFLYGAGLADTLDGNNGSDTLYGFSGNDTLTGDSGHDTLFGGSGADILKAGSGDDHIYAGTGNDLAINGYTGNDTYYFGLGDGNNSINNNDTDSSSVDKVVFLAGVLPDAINVVRNGNHLVFELTQSAETLTISNYYRDEKSKIDLLEFENGEIWDQAMIAQRVLLGSAADDVLSGTEAADVLAGQSGHDTLDGAGGDDLLSGDQGNDVLIGGAGSDSYLYESGDGDDAISMQGQTLADLDRLVLGEGLLAGNTSLNRVGGDLLISFTDQSGSISVQSHFTDSQFELGAIDFAAGESWDAAYIDANVIGSDEPLNLVGTGSADTLQGAGGDDRLEGKGGSDTLLGEGGNDTLLGGGGADDLYGGTGADVLKGGGGHDHFYGGAGNDILTGGKGNDTYHFAPADGFDKINNGSNNFASETDVLSIEGGFHHDDLWFRKSSNHLDIYLLGSEDRVRVNNWYKADKFALDSVSAGSMQVDVSGIEALVSAMASFGAPQGGEVSLTTEEQVQIDSAIASSWQAA